jgi:hypothetical protein
VRRDHDRVLAFGITEADGALVVVVAVVAGSPVVGAGLGDGDRRRGDVVDAVSALVDLGRGRADRLARAIVLLIRARRRIRPIERERDRPGSVARSAGKRGLIGEGASPPLSLYGPPASVVSEVGFLPITRCSSVQVELEPALLASPE